MEEHRQKERSNFEEQNARLAADVQTLGLTVRASVFDLLSLSLCLFYVGWVTCGWFGAAKCCRFGDVML